MADGSSKVQVRLEDGPQEAVVVRGGITVEFNANGDVTVHTNGNVRLRPAVNDDAEPRAGDRTPRVGDRMPDGTRYAGISPETQKPMYTTPGDAPLTYTFNTAKEYSARLAAHGHQDWRVPTKAELNVLFQNRAAIGGFNETGSNPAGWYWSSSQRSDYGAWGQRFSDGLQSVHGKLYSSSLRCVR